MKCPGRMTAPLSARDQRHFVKYIMIMPQTCVRDAACGCGWMRTQSAGTGVLCIKNLSLHSAAVAAVMSLLCCMKTLTSMVDLGATTSCMHNNLSSQPSRTVHMAGAATIHCFTVCARTQKELKSEFYEDAKSSTWWSVPTASG